jgi:hypothetical protein
MESGDGTGFLITAFLVAFYLLPAFVAGFRNHPNTAAISALNLLLGWTFLGWVAALVWSLTAIQEGSKE